MGTCGVHCQLENPEKPVLLRQEKVAKLPGTTGTAEILNEVFWLVYDEGRSDVMIKGVGESRWRVGQHGHYRDRGTRVQYGGSEDAFAHSPLREAHGLATINKHFAGPAPGEADYSIPGFALQRAFVHGDLSHDVVA